MRLRKSLRWIVLAMASVAPWLTSCETVCREPECPVFRPESHREYESPAFRPGSAEDETEHTGIAGIAK